MSLVTLDRQRPTCTKALLDRFGQIADPAGVLAGGSPAAGGDAPSVCGTICDCADDDLIAAWGGADLPILRYDPPCHHSVPGASADHLMNRIDPHLFAQAFTDRVRAIWPQRPGFVATVL